MYRCISHLVTLLLCYLLPVQGALAFAQSVGSVSHHVRPVQATARLTTTHNAPVAHRHHHHGHPQAHHAAHLSLDPRDKASTKSMSHSQATCADCAKCCLTGATAPPPVAAQLSAIPFVLTAFQPVSIDLALHIPEKPERPPRVFPRALS